jgi:hypothetical protein
MSEAEVMEQQERIEPSIKRLIRHFLAQRKQAAAPFVREGKKVGRNDPCPCGSGKKFKHCLPALLSADHLQFAQVRCLALDSLISRRMGI